MSRLHECLQQCSLMGSVPIGNFPMHGDNLQGSKGRVDSIKLSRKGTPHSARHGARSE